MSVAPVTTIRGGAGLYEAAVVAAVIQRVLDDEAAVRAIPPRGNVPPAWVRSGQPVAFGRFVPVVVPDPGRNWPI